MCVQLLFNGAEVGIVRIDIDQAAYRTETIRFATSWAEALAAIARVRPAVIVLDLRPLIRPSKTRSRPSSLSGSGAR